MVIERLRKGYGTGKKGVSHYKIKRIAHEFIYKKVKHACKTAWSPWARGGDSNIKMPGCVCLVSENRPILNDTLSCKTYPY